MIKVLFICHGNICRSPMAEFVMKDLVQKAGCLSSRTAEAGGAWDLLRGPCGPAAHQSGLRRIRPAHRHGPGQPAEYVPYLRRRLLRQDVPPDGTYRPPRRCSRPVVHRRLRDHMAGCAGWVPGVAEGTYKGANIVCC